MASFEKGLYELCDMGLSIRTVRLNLIGLLGMLGSTGIQPFIEILK